MATMTKLDRNQAIQLAKTTQRPLENRVPTGPHDYGDELTVGLQMKRNTYALGDDDGMDSFGMYLGHHAQGWVILVWDLFWNPTGAEVFSTLEEMKSEWRLD